MSSASYGPVMMFGPDGPGTARPRGADAARVQQVVVTKTLRGRGTKEDLCRIVTQFWSLDGELLAENDPSGVEMALIAVKKWAWEEQDGSGYKRAQADVRRLLYPYIGEDPV